MWRTHEQVFDWYGTCEAMMIVSTHLVQYKRADVHPGEEHRAYKIEFTVDKDIQEFDNEEIRPLLVVSSMLERKQIIERAAHTTL